MKNTMNEVQQKLVEDNIYLVPFMINKLGLGRMYDDFIDIGWIGLCQGALTFNDDISKASTYLCICIKNALMGHLAHITAPSFDFRVPVLSLEKEYTLPNGERVILADVIPSKETVEDQYDYNELLRCIDEAIEECVDVSEKYRGNNTRYKINDKRALIEDYFGFGDMGKSTVEIAKEHGVTKQRCTQIIRQFKKKLLKILQKSVDI